MKRTNIVAIVVGFPWGDNNSVTLKEIETWNEYRDVAERQEIIMKTEDNPMAQQLKETLNALIKMWNQYCWESWHAFMSAWEGAQSIFEEYWLIPEQPAFTGYLEEVE